MISVEHLTKYYGDFQAVSDLSFEIGDRGVFGFLGPNGAGKSTTMNIMTGCLSPTSGKVTVGGFDILLQPEKAKGCIGYLPELPPLYTNETPEEYLTFVGEAKGLRKAELRRQVEEVLAETKLTEMRHRLISELSKGYRQRVGIAQALLGSPRVIILDEPTVGLDPLQIIEIRELIRHLGEEHTVILSSHILSEVQAICDRVLIIAHGRLVAFDTPEKLEKLLRASSGIRVVTEGTPDGLPELLAGVPGVEGWDMAAGENGTLSLDIRPADGADGREVCRALNKVLTLADRPVLEMSTKKANLEDVFIELTEGTGEQLHAPGATEAPTAPMTSPVTETTEAPETTGAAEAAVSSSAPAEPEAVNAPETVEKEARES